jgi:GTP-binding protein
VSSPTALVAIVGRPNVGKSTLYNRMVGGRPALVHDTPGLTRDRRYGQFEYFGTTVRVVDTGGLDPEAESDVIGAGIHRQARRAIEEADLVLLVVDGAAGVTPLDKTIVEQIRTTGKPMLLACNKIDSPKRDTLANEFYELGLGEPFPISAAHGRGVDDLLDALVAATQKAVPPSDDGDDDEVDAPDDEEQQGDDDGRADWHANRPLRVALVGKPNAGKSSLLNRLVGEERSLVHHVAGTTTDPVDTEVELRGKKYVLVDTAGIRRKARIEEDVEKLSVTLALAQIERADVVVLVIDASLGPSEQDARLAGLVEDAGKALVLALNKSDLVAGDLAKDALKQGMKDTYHFLPWAPTTMLSARRGDGVDRLLDVVDQVAAQYRRRISTSELNRFFAEVCEITPPPVHRGKAVRVYYMTQGRVAPPTFLLFCNDLAGLSTSYRRFVANQLRKRYGFRGTPLRVLGKAKPPRPQGMAPRPKKKS